MYGLYQTEAIQLKSKLENFQFELELVLDDVRDVLRPSIEADIAATTISLMS